MRLAVLADVHGNLRALEAVLADLSRHAPDAVVNLGDCVSGPLAALPATAVVGDGAAHDALLCHGSPADDLAYLVETVGPHGAALARPAEVAARLGATAQRLVLCGHTHLPRLVATGHVAAGDDRLVVNPGSVGLPAFADDAPFPHAIEAGSPHARYAVVDTGPRPRVHFAAVAYDWEAAADDARRAGSPAWARALATGYAAGA